MGEIANYKTGECYLCNKKFKGKAGLYYHFKNSKNHWIKRKQMDYLKRKELDEYL